MLLHTSQTDCLCEREGDIGAESDTHTYTVRDTGHTVTASDVTGYTTWQLLP